MLKGLTSTWKNGCNAKTLTLSEYIIIDNKKIPVKAVLKDDCYNNGNFIGTFIFKEISFEVENNIDFKRKEFEYYKVVNGEAIKFGTFITTEITDNDTTELVKVVGMDFGLKTQVEYMSSLDYSSGLITLLDVWNECCELSGLVSGITDFTNSDFIVESDQFTGTGATIRDVFVAIAQSSCTFVKIMNDDKIYLIFNEYESNKKDGKAVIIDNSIYNTNLKLQLYGKSVQAISTNPVSPSPDYPSEITNIASNVKIEISGKNRWNNDLITDVVTKNTDGFTITNIWANGVLENQNVLKTFKPNTKYTIKIKRKILDKPTTIGSNTTYDLVLYKPGAWYPLDDYKKYETNVGDVITTYRTITTPADLSDYRVLCYSFFGNNNGSTNYRGLGSVEIQEIMVVEGSYTAETFPQYEAYQGTSVDINLNGNVLTEYDKLIIKDGRAIIQKKSRNLSLAIADMANGEDYPGWRNVTYLGEDYPNKNTHMREFCNYKCNIAEFSKGGVGINSVYGNSTLFLSKGMFDLTQSQWKEQYPDLVFNLIYELAEPYEIDLGEITTLKTLNGTTYITNSEDAEMQITYTSDKLPKVKYKNDVGNLLDLVPNKISELDNDSFKALSNTEIEALINKQV